MDERGEGEEGPVRARRGRRGPPPPLADKAVARRAQSRRPVPGATGQAGGLGCWLAQQLRSLCRFRSESEKDAVGPIRGSRQGGAAGLLKQADGRRFEGAFVGDAPTGGVYVDPDGAAFDVVFRPGAQAPHTRPLADLIADGDGPV